MLRGQLLRQAMNPYMFHQNIGFFRGSDIRDLYKYVDSIKDTQYISLENNQHKNNHNRT